MQVNTEYNCNRRACNSSCGNGSQGSSGASSEALNKLQSELDALKTKIESIPAVNNTTVINELKQTINDLKTTVSNLQNSVGSTDVSTINTKVSELETKVSNIEKTLQTIQNELKNISTGSTDAALKKKVDDLAAALEELKNTVQTLSTSGVTVDSVTFSTESDGRKALVITLTGGVTKKVYTGFEKEITLEANKPLNINHQLNRKYVDISVYDKASGNEVHLSEVIVDENNITLESDIDGEYVVVINS